MCSTSPALAIIEGVHGHTECTATSGQGVDDGPRAEGGWQWESSKEEGGTDPMTGTRKVTESVCQPLGQKPARGHTPR